MKCCVTRTRHVGNDSHVGKIPRMRLLEAASALMGRYFWPHAKICFGIHFVACNKDPLYPCNEASVSYPVVFCMFGQLSIHALRARSRHDIEEMSCILRRSLRQASPRVVITIHGQKAPGKRRWPAGEAGAGFLPESFDDLHERSEAPGRDCWM